MLQPEISARGIEAAFVPSAQPSQSDRSPAVAAEALRRARNLLAGTDPDAATVDAMPMESSGFVPRAPEALKQARLSERDVESLVLKFLLNSNSAPGRRISEQLGLPFKLMVEFLQHLKNEQLIVHRTSSSVNDYVFELTPSGRERAHHYAEQSTYYGAAPVAIDEYIDSVRAQSVTNQRPSIKELCAAFADLNLDIDMICRLGQAIHSGSALFLYGAPGNGKTSVAQRITHSFGESLWIPRAIGASGEIVRLYDQSNHNELPLPSNDGLVDQRGIDMRWVRIRRPTIIVGGELSMDNLEITNNKLTGISEAPVQLKSNGGTLVIDDFGRQRMSTRELLNRWIIPLENGYDFLEMASGRRVQVPFDQMIVFSTNLEPRELVDEAFLRRIPYKIEMGDPTEDQYRVLFLETALKLGLKCSPDLPGYLLERHYRGPNRPLRFCHPRDLLKQVEIFCSFSQQPLEVTEKALDSVVGTYFGSL
jgi:predicted ATPase with chaperone activity